jgi:hypothetical protein
MKYEKTPANHDEPRSAHDKNLRLPDKAELQPELLGGAAAPQLQFSPRQFELV